MVIEHRKYPYIIRWRDTKAGGETLILREGIREPLLTIETNGVPPQIESLELLLEATINALNKAFEKALLYGRIEKAPIKGSIKDLKFNLEINGMESEE